MELYMEEVLEKDQLVKEVIDRKVRPGRGRGKGGKGRWGDFSSESTAYD